MAGFLNLSVQDVVVDAVRRLANEAQAQAPAETEVKQPAALDSPASENPLAELAFLTPGNR